MSVVRDWPVVVNLVQNDFKLPTDKKARTTRGTGPLLKLEFLVDESCGPRSQLDSRSLAVAGVEIVDCLDVACRTAVFVKILGVGKEGVSDGLCQFRTDDARPHGNDLGVI